jgi:hypothetical protein
LENLKAVLESSNAKRRPGLNPGCFQTLTLDPDLDKELCQKGITETGSLEHEISKTTFFQFLQQFINFVAG